MPTYEYKCLDCEHCFEVFHGVNESKETCPRCGGNLRRVFHPVGIIFKGSGFYTTEYRKSSGNGDGGPPEKKEEKKTEKAVEGASDRKEDSS